MDDGDDDCLVLFSHSKVSDSSQPHELQQPRLPCPPTPGDCSNSCPLRQWCHSTILSSVIPFSSCLQSFPALGSFPMSQFITSDDQDIGVSDLASVLQWIFRTDSFRMDWLDLLAVQGTLKSLLQHHSSKASILQCSDLGFFIVQLSHPYMTTEKTMTLTRRIFFGKVMSLLFNMLSRFVTPFLSRSKCLNFMAAVTWAAVILEPKEIKSVTVSTVSPFICHEVMGLDAMIFVFWMLSCKPAFSLSSFTFVKRLFSSFSLLP